MESIETRQVYSPLHEHDLLTREAMKDLVHEAQCACHVTRHRRHLEGLLYAVSVEATRTAQREERESSR